MLSYESSGLFGYACHGYEGDEWATEAAVETYWQTRFITGGYRKVPKKNTYHGNPSGYNGLCGYALMFTYYPLVAGDNLEMLPCPLIQDLTYTYPCWVEGGMINHVSDRSKLYIRTLDKTKYFRAYLYPSNYRCYMDSHDPVYDYTYFTTENYGAGERFIVRLEVNADGTVSIHLRSNGYSTSSCAYRHDTNTGTYTTGTAIFSPGDSLEVGIIHNGSSLFKYLQMEWMKYSVTFFEEENDIVMLNCSTDIMDPGFPTTQDNDTGIGGRYIQWDDDAGTRETVADEIFEVRRPDDPDNNYFYYLADYTRLYGYEDDVMIATTRGAIYQGDYFEFAARYCVGQAWSLHNKDYSKWLLFYVYYVNPEYLLTVLYNTFDEADPFYRGTVDIGPTDSYRGERVMIDEAGVIRFDTYKELLTSMPPIWEVDTWSGQKGSFFDPGEALYFSMCLDPSQYGDGGISSIRFYEHTWFCSHMFSHSSAVGQTPNVAFRCSPDTVLEMELTDEIVNDHVCYFKNKIINTREHNDINSMMGMNPDYPSDAATPLKADDACIVNDKYNRFYFYQVRSGDVLDNRPDIFRIDDARYWELVECLSQPVMIVEQYDIVGLVDTNEVVVTHSAHNRFYGYAPLVQFIHNGKWRTNGLGVAVASTTQLRITTDETTVLTDLKLNIYISQ